MLNIHICQSWSFWSEWKIGEGDACVPSDSMDGKSAGMVFDSELTGFFFLQSSNWHCVLLLACYNCLAITKSTESSQGKDLSGSYSGSQQTLLNNAKFILLPSGEGVQGCAHLIS